MEKENYIEKVRTLELEITANYKWWRHPIKYWRERKKRALLQTKNRL